MCSETCGGKIVIIFKVVLKFLIWVIIIVHRQKTQCDISIHAYDV